MRCDVMRIAMLGVWLLACGQSPYSDFNGPRLRPDNLAPLVSLGFDEVVPRGSPVTLSATALDANDDELSYLWTQTAGPAVALSSSDTLVTSFTAPDGAVSLTFTFTASDGMATATDDIIIATQNSAPWLSTASLSPGEPDTTTPLVVSTTVEDFDGDEVVLTYQWFVNGTEVSGATTDTLSDDEFVRDDIVSVVVSASDGVLTDSDSDEVTILDAAPVITASLPTSATYGVALTGAGISAVDPDGDSFTMRLAYGPNGMSMDNEGQITWTPGGVMFDTTLEVHFGVEFTTAFGTDILDGSIMVTDASRDVPLVRTGIQVAPSNETVLTGDFDEDGKTEILMAGEAASFDGGELLFSLELDGAEYVQDWVYPFDLHATAAISSLAAADQDGDDALDILVAAGEHIFILDGVDGRVRTTVDEVDGATIECLRIADLGSSDGVLELAYLVRHPTTSLGEIVVRDLETLTELWRKDASDHGRRLQVGNVDADSALELVTSSGYVYDGLSEANEWLKSGGFASDGISDGVGFALGDVDGDGTAEIVTFDEIDDVIIAYDAVQKAELWRADAPASSTAMVVLNVDDDNAAEVLTADWSTGVGRGVHVFSYSAGTPKLVEDQFLLQEDDGVYWMVYADVDDDATKELVFGMGLDSTGPNSLAVAHLGALPAIEWSNTSSEVSQLDGPFFGGAWATVAASDARAVFMTASTNSGYGDARLIAMKTDGTLAISATPATAYADPICLAPGDFEGDGIDEIYLGTTGGFSGDLRVYDVLADAPRWSLAADAEALIAADFNADGKDELALIDTAGHVVVHDVANATELYNSGALGGAGVDLELVDLGGTATPEIVALTSTHIAVLTRTGNLTYSIDAVALPGTDASDLAVADFDGDGDRDIAVGAFGFWSTPYVWVFDAALELTSSCTPETDAAALYVEPGSGVRKNLLVAQRSATLAAMDAFSCGVVWESPRFYGTPQKNSLSTGDKNSDGNVDLTFGTDDAMVLTR